MRTGRKPVRNRNRTTLFQLADTGTTTELRTIGLADISGRFSGKTTGRQWKYLGQRKNAFFRLDPCSNYEFVKMDICDFEAFLRLMREKRIDGIIHLAAESHVDRSIKDPFTFAQTNVMGTLSLLQAAKLYWESLPEKYTDKLFYHISTDEVYGALEFTS